jgi:alkylation response protein AidB-like acyl-CoA dehydrogenase
VNLQGTVAAFLEPRHRAIAERAVAVAQDIVAELGVDPDGDDEARARLPEIAWRLGERGLLEWAYPEPWGRGLDLRSGCLVREALAAQSPLADDTCALQALGAMPIVLGGDEAQRARWLPAIARGAAVAAFAMTEPEAGSDVAAMTTTARREGDSWVLDGVKHLISNAGIADVVVVFASTNAALSSRGISCFVLAASTPGLTFDGAQVLAAPHPLGRLRFEHCRVPADALLGSVDQGFALGMRSLDRLRATVAAAACGMARRALEESLAHVRRRRQFGKPLADLDVVRERLATMAIELEAARLLTFRAAAEVDRGAARPTLAVAAAKAFATEAAQRIVDTAVQLHGGAGVLVGSPVERLYRAVRALRIYEGATDVQHVVVARELLRAGRGLGD